MTQQDGGPIGRARQRGMHPQPADIDMDMLELGHRRTVPRRAALGRCRRDAAEPIHGGVVSYDQAMSSSIDASHIGLCVSNLERSLKFYVDGLGFELGIRYDLDDTMMPGMADALEVASPVQVVSQFIVKDGMSIELLAYQTPEAGGTPSSSRGQLGFTHLSFYVDDVDATAARLVEAGGTILGHTRVSVGVELLFLADPDGARVELMSPKPAKDGQ